MQRVRGSGTGSRRGGVLVLALIVVLVVATMAGSFLQLNSAATRRQALSVDNKLAFYVAEAGLTESFLALVEGKSGDVASPELPATWGEGLVWARAEELDGGFVRVEATGTCGRGRAVLSIVLERARVSPAHLGIHSGLDLVLPEGAYLDGYDSSEADVAGASFAQGPDAASAAGSAAESWWRDTISGWWSRRAGAEDAPARISSGGSIVVRATPGEPTTVRADLVCGPEGSVVLVGEPHVEGARHRASAPVALEPLEPPAVPRGGDLTPSGGTPYVVDPGEVGLGDLAVGLESTLVLVGPLTLVVESLSLAPTAALVVDDRGGRVQVFVEREVDLAEGSSFRQLGTRTTEFELHVAGSGTSRLAAEGRLHGLVHAPNGSLALGAELETFGSVVAERLLLEPGATLHVDRHLVDRAAAALLPRLVSWRLVELVELEAPHGTTGVDRAACPPLAAATPGPRLTLAYTDWADVERTFDGPWDDFEGWHDVRVLGVARRDGVDLPGAERERLLAHARRLQRLARTQTVDLLKDLTGHR